MSQDDRSQRAARRGGVLVLVAAALLVGGCEVDSFMDPSVVGRWERTPVVLPILDQLDVIDEPSSQPPGLSPVRSEDLIADVQEYVIGPGDTISISVFELLQPNVESVQRRLVDPLGVIRLPVIGAIEVEGLTPTQLEARIKKVLADKAILNDPLVSVIVELSRQNTYSVIGEPAVAGTAIGTYNILGNNFRLLDAMALARGVPGSIKKLYVIRQVPLARQRYVTATSDDAASKAQPKPAPPTDPAKLIDDLLNGIEPQRPAPPNGNAPGGAANPGGAAGPEGEVAAADAPKPPPALEAGLDQNQSGHWVYVDDRWVRVDETGAPGSGSRGSSAAPPESAQDPGAPKPEQIIAQRIIEVPYDKLLDGDMRYNMVIRAGDIIRVPPPVIGNVYIGGAISRPGTFALPGDRDLTLKQLIFAAGNLSPLAIPERVDLIRRVGKDREATVRINLRAIFDGTQPDFFLKPNDTINVGTNFMAAPLAVVRNGFRMSYGFGFILDRNFGYDIFGPTNNF